jgi:hypothetical protein
LISKLLPYSAPLYRFNADAVPGKNGQQRPRRPHNDSPALHRHGSPYFLYKAISKCRSYIRLVYFSSSFSPVIFKASHDFCHFIIVVNSAVPLEQLGLTRSKGTSLFDFAQKILRCASTSHNLVDTPQIVGNTPLHSSLQIFIILQTTCGNEPFAGFTTDYVVETHIHIVQHLHSYAAAEGLVTFFGSGLMPLTNRLCSGNSLMACLGEKAFAQTRNWPITNTPYCMSSG